MNSIALQPHRSSNHHPCLDPRRCDSYINPTSPIAPATTAPNPAIPNPSLPGAAPSNSFVGAPVPVGKAAVLATEDDALAPRVGLLDGYGATTRLEPVSPTPLGVLMSGSLLAEGVEGSVVVSATGLAET